jgi:hypothetical protein
MTEHQKEIWSGVLMATLFVGMLGVLERPCSGDFSKRISLITMLKPGGSGCPT